MALSVKCYWALTPLNEGFISSFIQALLNRIIALMILLRATNKFVYVYVDRTLFCHKVPTSVPLIDNQTLNCL